LNGSRFLNGSGTIKGISLYPDKFGRVAVYFDNFPVALPDNKKPDTGETKRETAKETESGLTKAPGGATGSGGATTTTTTAPTGGKKGISLEALQREFNLKPKPGAKLAEDTPAIKRGLKNKILPGDYNGFFEPDGDGVLYDDDLASDLKEGLMPPDELLDGILEYNKKQAKKPLGGQKTIDVVNLIAGNLRPVIYLSADQMARAKGFVFITDGKGAKEAKEDKRFVTMEYDYDDKTFAYVFVLLGNGNLTEKQEKEMKDLKEWARNKKQELKIFGYDKIKADKSQPKETFKGIPIKVKRITRVKKLITKKVSDEQSEKQDKAKGETEKRRQEEEEKAKEVERQRKEEEERRRREEEDLKRLKEENERNLKGSEFSGEELQKAHKAIENTKNTILRLVRQAKGEYTVKKHTLYLCSVEEIIKAADENKNLTKLILPWQKCQRLYPRRVI